MFLLQNVWRQEAKNVALGHVEQQAPLQRGFRQGSSGDRHLQPLQQAAPAHGCCHGQFLGEHQQLLAQVVACLMNAMEHAFPLHDGEKLQPQTAGQRAASQRAAMLAETENMK